MRGAGAFAGEFCAQAWVMGGCPAWGLPRGSSPGNLGAPGSAEPAFPHGNTAEIRGREARERAAPLAGRPRPARGHAGGLHSSSCLGGAQVSGRNPAGVLREDSLHTVPFTSVFLK